MVVLYGHQDFVLDIKKTMTAPQRRRDRKKRRELRARQGRREPGGGRRGRQGRREPSGGGPGRPPPDRVPPGCVPCSNPWRRKSICAICGNRISI